MPEVETIRRDLLPHVVGRRVTEADVRWPGTIQGLSPRDFRSRLLGRRVVGIGRRGKYFLFHLSEGWTLIVHLGMTGQLLTRPPEERAQSWTRVAFGLEGARGLWFVDPRKFGRIYLVEDPDSVVGRLGPEPMEDRFSARQLAELLERRSGILKPLLLNQGFVAGVGNIYADEALFAARLRPDRKADTLRPDEVVRLHRGIRRALRRGLRDAGSSVDFYRRPDGREGGHQEKFLVFRRTGEACARCGTTIERIVLGGRSTHFCPGCQL
ncbi:MAG: bifunctional DNA-formamidopyrimidine glycosylase/DNA-(apurinic or apyrimidinic site) lyase [Anaerolineae bacterium]